MWVLEGMSEYMSLFSLIFLWQIFEYVHADGKEWRGKD